MTWRGRNIYLVGLPGAGKTAIGRELALLLKKSGYSFLDLDESIELRSAKRIADIFQQAGEHEFRNMETKELLEASQHAYTSAPLVVATGGGTILRDVNRAIMRGSGIVVWLDVNVRAAARKVLKNILEGNPRPLLISNSPEDLTAKLRVMAEKRSGFYQQATLHFVMKSQRGEERFPAEFAEELFVALEQMSRHIRLRPRFQALLSKSAFGDDSILIGNGIAQTEISQTIRDLSPTHVVILTDKNVARLHTKSIVQKLAVEFRPKTTFHQIAIDPGEKHKTSETLFEVLNSLMKLEVPRRGGLMITIGGGVVSDLGGLAASLYKRGLPLIHIPTTLLGQCDAAIGGKTGIDYVGMKNGIGTFYPAERVLIDPLFLKTLDKRELHAGLGEVFKYALIGSSEMWTRLARSVRRLVRGVDPSYEPIIRDAVREKLRVVERDEFERRDGVRELLNFGHTFGHALEAATHFETFLHGEAVLLGMRAAVWLSMQLQLITEATWREIEIVLGRIPIAATTDVSVQEVLVQLVHDKKRSASGNRFILLQGIGNAIIVDQVPEQSLKDALKFMLSLI